MAVSAKCLIAAPNYVVPQVAATVTATVAVVTPTFSNGTWSASFPLANLALGKLYKPIRSTAVTAASTKLDIDLQVARPINVVALIRHNLTPVVGTATVRVRLSNDPTFATSLYDNGTVSAYQAGYAANSLPDGWNAANWTGAPTQDMLQAYKSLAFTQVTDQQYVARYVRIEITDTTNTAGFVQLGGIFVGPGFQPSINMSTGATIGWNDPSTMSTGDGGVRFYRPRARFREAQFVLDLVNTDQAMELLFELEGRMGTASPLFFVLDPTTANHMHRWSFLCNYESLNALAFPYAAFQYAQKPIKLIEVL